MRRLRARFALLGTTIAALAVVAPAGSAPANAAPSCSGVIVVVDFGHWGGPLQRGCASAPTSGLDALHDAGFPTAGTAQSGGAYVCRIDNLPSADDEACVVTPPTSAYWGYYYAMPGDASWTYSAIGASSRRPPRGSIEGWAFGPNAKPRLTPAQIAPAPPPPPPPPTRPPVQQGGPEPTVLSGGTVASPGPATGPPPGAPKSATTVVPPAANGGTSASTEPTKRTTTSRADEADDDVKIVERSAAANPSNSSDSGSPVALIVTVVVVAGVATAGAFVARQRRRSVP